MRKRLQVSRQRRCDGHRTGALWMPIGLVVLVASAAMLPAFLSTAELDLFDLTPKTDRVDGYRLLAWPELERGRAALRVDALSTGEQVRALGYMAKGREHLREGQLVRRFILLPEQYRGSDDQRFGDRMIEVRLTSSAAFPFSDGRLLWAWGILRALPGNPNGEAPLYFLETIRIEPVNRAEIARYYR
jgi:hypothetical protein